MDENKCQGGLGAETDNSSLTLEDIERKMTPKVAAKKLGLSPSTLAAWRSRGNKGLPYHKIGNKVFYLEKDVLAFIGKNRRK